ncbi:protein TOPAZ1 [Lissotriton helveticus]
MIELRPRKRVLKRIPVLGGRDSAQVEVPLNDNSNASAQVENKMVDGSVLPEVQSERLEQHEVVVHEKKEKRPGKRQYYSKSAVCSDSMSCTDLVVTRSSFRCNIGKGSKVTAPSEPSLLGFLIDSKADVSCRQTRSSVARHLLNCNHTPCTGCTKMFVASPRDLKNKALAGRMGRTPSVRSLKGVDANNKAGGKKRSARDVPTEHTSNSGPSGHAASNQLMVESQIVKKRLTRSATAPTPKGNEVDNRADEISCSQDHSSLHQTLKACPRERARGRIWGKVKGRPKPQVEPAVISQCGDTGPVSLKSKDFERRNLESHFQSTLLKNRSDGGNTSSSTENMSAEDSKLRGSSALGETAAISLKGNTVRRRNIIKGELDDWSREGNHCPTHSIKRFVIDTLKETKRHVGRVVTQSTLLKDNTSKRRGRPCHQPNAQSSLLENRSHRRSKITKSVSAQQMLTVSPSEPLENSELRDTIPVCLKGDVHKHTKQACCNSTVQLELAKKPHEGNHIPKCSSAEKSLNAVSNEPQNGSLGPQSTCSENKSVTRRGSSRFQSSVQSHWLESKSDKESDSTISSSAEMLNTDSSEHPGSGVLMKMMPIGLKEGPVKRSRSFHETSIQVISKTRSLEAKHSSSQFPAEQLQDEDLKKKRGRPRLHPPSQSRVVGKKSNEGSQCTTSSSTKLSVNVVPSESTGSNVSTVMMPLCSTSDIVKRRKRACLEPSYQRVKAESDDGNNCATHASSEQLLNTDAFVQKGYVDPVVARTNCLKDVGVKRRRGRPRLQPQSESGVLQDGVKRRGRPSLKANSQSRVLGKKSHQGNLSISNSSVDQIAPSDATREKFEETAHISLKGDSVEKKERTCLQASKQEVLERNTCLLRSSSKQLLNADLSQSRVMVPQSNSVHGKVVKKRGRPRVQLKFQSCGAEEKSDKGGNVTTSSSGEQTLKSVPNDATGNSVLSLEENICVKHDTDKEVLVTGSSDGNYSNILSSEQLLTADSVGSEVATASQKEDICVKRSRGEPHSQAHFLSSGLRKSNKGSHGTPDFSAEEIPKAVSCEPTEKSELGMNLHICLKRDTDKRRNTTSLEHSIEGQLETGLMNALPSEFAGYSVQEEMEPTCLRGTGIKMNKSASFEQGVLENEPNEGNNCPGCFSSEQLIRTSHSQSIVNSRSVMEPCTYLKDKSLERGRKPLPECSRKETAVEQSFGVGYCSTVGTPANEVFNSNSSELTKGNTVVLEAKENTEQRKEKPTSSLQGYGVRDELQEGNLCVIPTCTEQKQDLDPGRLYSCEQSTRSLTCLKGEYVKERRARHELNLQVVNGSHERKRFISISAAESMLDNNERIEGSQSVVAMPPSFKDKIVKERRPACYPNLQEKGSCKGPVAISRSWDKKAKVDKDIEVSCREADLDRRQVEVKGSDMKNKHRVRLLVKMGKEANSPVGRSTNSPERVNSFNQKTSKSLLVPLRKSEDLPNDLHKAIEHKQHRSKEKTEALPLLSVPSIDRYLGNEGETDEKKEAASFPNVTSNHRLQRRGEAQGVKITSTQVTTEDSPVLTSLNPLNDCTLKTGITASNTSGKKDAPPACKRASFGNVPRLKSGIAIRRPGCTDSSRSNYPDQGTVENKQTDLSLIECSNGQNMELSKCFNRVQFPEQDMPLATSQNSLSIASISSVDVNSNVCNAAVDFYQVTEEFVGQRKSKDVLIPCSASSDANGNHLVAGTEESSSVLVERDEQVVSLACQDVLSSDRYHPHKVLAKTDKTTGIKRKRANKDAENVSIATLIGNEKRLATEFKNQMKKGREDKVAPTADIGNLETLVGDLNKNGLFPDSFQLNNDFSPENYTDKKETCPNKEFSDLDNVDDLLEEAISLLSFENGNYVVDTECKNGETDEHFAFDHSEIVNNSEAFPIDKQIESATLNKSLQVEEAHLFSCQRAVPMVGKHVWKFRSCARTYPWPFSEDFRSSFKTNTALAAEYEEPAHVEIIKDVNLVKEIGEDIPQLVAGEHQESACKKKKLDLSLESASCARDPNPVADMDDIHNCLSTPLLTDSTIAPKTCSSLPADALMLQTQKDETLSNGNDSLQIDVALKNCIDLIVEGKIVEDNTASVFTPVADQAPDNLMNAGNERHLGCSSQQAESFPETLSNTESSYKEIISLKSGTVRGKENVGSLITSSDLKLDHFSACVHEDLQQKPVHIMCSKDLQTTTSQHFSDECSAPTEDIASNKSSLLESTSLKQCNPPASENTDVTFESPNLEDSRIRDSLNDDYLWEFSTRSQNLKNAQNEMRPTNEVAVVEDDVLLLDVIQDDPELFGGSTEEESKSELKSARVQQELFKDISTGNQPFIPLVSKFSDDLSSKSNESADSPIQEHEDSINYEIGYSKPLFTDKKSRTLDESTAQSLECGLPLETDKRKVLLPLPVDDDVKEEDFDEESNYSAYEDSVSGVHRTNNLLLPLVENYKQEFKNFPPRDNAFTGKWSSASRPLLPTPPTYRQEPWKEQEYISQRWQSVERSVLPAGYCHFYFNTVRGCCKPKCWFSHVPKEEDEKLCMEIVQKLNNADTPSVLHRAVEVFTSYYREFSPGVHYDSHVLDELLISLLKHFMLSDLFHIMNIGVNVKILPSAEVFLKVIDHVSSNNARKAVPTLVDIFCKMVEAGMVLQLEHLDYIEKHVTQLEGSEIEINVIASTKSRLQARQFKKNWICDLDAAVAEIEHCKEQADWIKLGTLYVNIRMGFENLPDLKKLSHCIAEALSKDSKEEKVVPFCLFADTVKKDPLHNGVDKKLLGRIGISLMFTYHKSEQWVKGKKIIDKLHDMQIHFTVMQGLVGEGSEATRCKVVNVATEILVKSGSLEGAISVLKESEWVISTPLWPCERMEVLNRHNLLCRIAHQLIEKSLYQQTFDVLQHLPGLQDATDALDVTQYSILFNKLLESCVENQSLGLSSNMVDFMASKNIPVNLPLLRALITTSGRSCLWLKARAHYKYALTKGCYPAPEGNIYHKILLIPSFMSEIEMVLAIEMFMVSNAGSIQSPSGSRQKLQLVLKRFGEDTKSNKDAYQAAVQRLMQSVHLFTPKLFIKHLTMNITMEEVYVLEHWTAIKWLEQNMKWACKVWLF